MPDTVSVTVELPAKLEAKLRAAVETGAYRTLDEAVAEALSFWVLDRQALQVELDDFREKLRASENDLRSDMTMDEVRAHLASCARSDEAA